MVNIDTQRNPIAGSIPQTLPPHFWKKMATNMVHITKKEAILVLSPSIRNNPPTASLKAPIQAKNTGAKAKIPPYSATSFGNQAATSKKPRLAVDDHGNPNLSEPKLEVNRYPQIILGMANKKSPIQCFWITGVISVFDNFKTSVFISMRFVRFDETKLQLRKRIRDSLRLRTSYIRFEPS